MISSSWISRADHGVPDSSVADSNRPTRSTTASSLRCSRRIRSTISSSTARFRRMPRLRAVGSHLGSISVTVPWLNIAPTPNSTALPTGTRSSLMSKPKRVRLKDASVRPIASGTSSTSSPCDASVSQRSSMSWVAATTLSVEWAITPRMKAGCATWRCPFQASPSSVSSPSPKKILNFS